MHEELSPPELADAIARLSALFGPRQGGIRPLEGGVSNRNLLVNFGGTDYVVRLPGKDTELLGIDREAERLATRKASELGMAPKVAAMLDDPACLVTCFVEAEPMTPGDLRASEAVPKVASALRSFHECGLDLPATFDVFELIDGYAGAARARGAELPDGFPGAIARAERIANSVRRHPEHERRPTHNDLLSANFLRTADGVVLVDWEYAGMGDPFFDLGGFAANNDLGETEERLLLESYFGEPATPRRIAALQLFRFLADFREAMWGVLQGSASTLDFDFAGYARAHFDRLAVYGDDVRFASRLDRANPSLSG